MTKQPKHICSEAQHNWKEVLPHLIHSPTHPPVPKNILKATGLLDVEAMMILFQDMKRMMMRAMTKTNLWSQESHRGTQCFAILIRARCAPVQKCLQLFAKRFQKPDQDLPNEGRYPNMTCESSPGQKIKTIQKRVLGFSSSNPNPIYTTNSHPQKKTGSKQGQAVLARWRFLRSRPALPRP